MGVQSGSRENSNGSLMFLSRAAEKVKRTGSLLFFLRMEKIVLLSPEIPVSCSLKASSFLATEWQDSV